MIDYDPNYIWPEFKSKSLPIALIPKIIHQFWLGDDAPMDLIEGWKKKNPSWSHILWTQTNLQSWKFRNQDKLDLIPEPSGKCDIMRYEVLYQMGGVSIDAKTECLQPLNLAAFQNDCTAILEDNLLSTNFLASQPKCELMRLCIENMNKVASPAWWYVGSAYLTYMANQSQFPVKAYRESEPEFKPMSCRRFGVMTHFKRRPKPATIVKRA